MRGWALLLRGPSVSARSSPKYIGSAFFWGPLPNSTASLFQALREGLRERGYVEERNFTFLQRYADGRIDRLPELAAELVRLKVDVIVTGSNLHVEAARQATSTIPIVMIYAADPVGAGFVASLARPGGNITGLASDASHEQWAKFVSLLTEAVPNLSRVGVIGRVSTVSSLLSSMRSHGCSTCRLRSPIYNARKTSTARSKR